MRKHRYLIFPLAALLVGIIELSATLGSLNGDPMDLVAGWAPTRLGDIWAVLLTITGSAALFAAPRFPAATLALTSGTYVVFILRDYEFGMTLPAMVTIFVLTSQGRRRLPALLAAIVCLGVTLVWIDQRTTTVTDEGVSTLAWVAFGTVSAAFFLLPVLLGELLRLRRLAPQKRQKPQ